MKIYLFTSDFKPPSINHTEIYEFYLSLKNREDVILVENYNEADYIFYMMHYRNCLELPYDNHINLDRKKINTIFNSGIKEVIIDYNDWTDTRNVPNEEVLKNIHKYFKRSMVNKQEFKLIKYPRDIIPISYGIRNDYIE